MQAAFNIGAMVRWLDFNDTWLAAEWGHPSDNLGGILAVADYLARKRRDAPARRRSTVRDVLTAMIKAHEIQGVLALENSFNRVGLDHVLLVRVASTAVVDRMLGGTREQIDQRGVQRLDRRRRAAHLPPRPQHRLAQELGGRRCHQPRRAAGADRAHRRDGLPVGADAPRPGASTTCCSRASRFTLPQPFGSYVMENVLFKISFPAEFHAQTAVEAAMTLHPQVAGPPRRHRAHRHRDAGAGRAHHRQDRPARQSRRPRPLHPVHGGGAADLRPPDGRGLRGRRRRRPAHRRAAREDAGAREPDLHAGLLRRRQALHRQRGAGVLQRRHAHRAGAGGLPDRPPQAPRGRHAGAGAEVRGLGGRALPAQAGRAHQGAVRQAQPAGCACR